MGQTNIFVRLLIVLRVQTISISNGLRDLYIKFGVSPERITVIPDGVDIAQFDIAISKEEARARLGIESNKKLVIYTGSLYAWKGTDTLEEAGRLLPENIEVKIVSGRPYAEIPLYLKSSDVLVLPNSALEIASKIYTSPMKLFEYMASGTLIITSDVPAIREILDESSAVFFKADDVVSLRGTLLTSLRDVDSVGRLAKISQKLALKYTWQSRAEQITQLI